MVFKDPAYMSIVTPKQRGTNWMALRKPYKKDRVFLSLAAGNNFIGLCSSKFFPYGNKFPTITKTCKGWCHCFRNPDNHLPAGVPRILLSESDFVAKPKASCISDVKKYDFAFVCKNSGTQKKSKNWPLMLKCLPILIEEMGLKGIIIGMGQKQYRHKRLQHAKDLPRKQFLQLLSKCRFLIIPAIRDASPRIIPEALYMGVPVVVNERIAGGWKYVNEETGAFFTNQEDVGDAVEKVLGKKYKRASSWLEANHSPDKSARMLKNFIATLDPSMAKHDRLYFTKKRA